MVTALTIAQLANVLVRRHRFEEADSLYRWVISVLRRQTSDSHVDVRRTYASVAALYDAWGKRDSAAVYRRRAGGVSLGPR